MSEQRQDRDPESSDEGTEGTVPSPRPVPLQPEPVPAPDPEPDLPPTPGAPPEPAQPEAAVEAEPQPAAEVEVEVEAPPDAETEAAEPEPVQPAAEAPPEPQPEAEPAPTPDPQLEVEDEVRPEPEAAAATPRPGPRPPSPADLARRTAGRPAVTIAPPLIEPTEAMAFGRTDEDGTVYVRTEDGERAVGSYPGAGPQEALAYFARKYDELVAATQLLAQRVAQPEVSSHDARESLKTLREQIGEANVVGDLPALHAQVEAIHESVRAKARAESQHRAEAKAEATAEREALVAEAEGYAAQHPEQVQWRPVSARMREIQTDWQAQQRRGPRLDKDVENALWHRLRAARTTFDKQRKVFFADLEVQHAEAKRAKEKLVAEAEKLATSRDWGPTASAFKQLMQRWRQAGRAQRAVDDALWARFKSAQDDFFASKDAVVAAENVEFERNLEVKEKLLAEAEAVLPVTRDTLESAKASLRQIQDRWDAAGKVPREAMARIEARLRTVEQAVRDVDEQRWRRSNPELTARAASMTAMFERAVQGAEADLSAAEATGDGERIAEAKRALDSQRALLDSARGGLAEYGG